MSEADVARETVEIDFDAKGLVPVVAQDAESGQVLMLAYANGAAIARTVATGVAHYYSRSREELWQKGETSGNVQDVEDVRIDCDGDTLLYRVTQEGGACHTGYETCFYRSVDGLSGAPGRGGRDGEGSGAGSEDAERATASEADGLAVETRVVGERAFDPETVYE